MKLTVTTLKALSDSNRLRVVAALVSEKELCACQIKELLQVTGATISRHMAQLIQAGVVESRKAGRWVYYRIPPGFSRELLAWLKQEFDRSRIVQKDSIRLQEIGSCDKIALCRIQRKRDSRGLP